jgi:hypothetical protein
MNRTRARIAPSPRFHRSGQIWPDLLPTEGSVDRIADVVESTRVIELVGVDVALRSNSSGGNRRPARRWLEPSQKLAERPPGSDTGLTQCRKASSSAASAQASATRSAHASPDRIRENNGAAPEAKLVRRSRRRAPRGAPSLGARQPRRARTHSRRRRLNAVRI